MTNQYWVAGAGEKQLERVERVEHREGRDGRVRESTQRLWVVSLNGELLGEYRTRREARLAHPDVYEEGDVR